MNSFLRQQTLGCWLSAWAGGSGGRNTGLREYDHLWGQTGVLLIIHLEVHKHFFFVYIFIQRLMITQHIPGSALFHIPGS